MESCNIVIVVCFLIGLLFIFKSHQSVEGFKKKKNKRKKNKRRIKRINNRRNKKSKGNNSPKEVLVNVRSRGNTRGIKMGDGPIGRIKKVKRVNV